MVVIDDELDPEDEEELDPEDEEELDPEDEDELDPEDELDAEDVRAAPGLTDVNVIPDAATVAERLLV